MCMLNAIYRSSHSAFLQFHFQCVSGKASGFFLIPLYEYAMFFQEKVNQIYYGLKEEQSGIVKSDVYEGSVTCRLSNYDLVSEEDVNKLICIRLHQKVVF